MDNFGSTLIVLRKRNNMTQRELAEALKISKSTVSMYENGTRKPSFKVLSLIADYFHVDIDILVGRENSKSKCETPNEIIATVRSKMIEDKTFFRAVSLLLSMEASAREAFISLFEKK